MNGSGFIPTPNKPVGGPPSKKHRHPLQAIIAAAARIDHSHHHCDASRIIRGCDGSIAYFRLHHKPGELTVLAVPPSGAHLTAVHPRLGFDDVPNPRILWVAPPVAPRQSAPQDRHQQRQLPWQQSLVGTVDDGLRLGRAGYQQPHEASGCSPARWNHPQEAVEGSSRYVGVHPQPNRGGWRIAAFSQGFPVLPWSLQVQLPSSSEPYSSSKMGGHELCRPSAFLPFGNELGYGGRP